MKKSMGSPVEEEGGEGTPDGLELLSIGSLYSGPWEKKYWSSSRGKDRYPYPVGYQAVRAHDGIRCKIEIHEGSKGPLFMITTPDGSSFCGQTPNMAWERFQKKGFPHMKIWHGKRFTCNIDCPEFFGFKNPLVQRLLRELVASIGGTAEQRLLSSSSCNVTLEVRHEKGLQSAVSHPDLLSCLAYPKFCRKRSWRPVNRSTVLNIGLGFKRSDQELVTGKVRRNSEPSSPIDDTTDNDVTDKITYPVCHDEKIHEVPSNCEPEGIDCGTSSDPKELDRFRETERHVSSSSIASLPATDLEDSEYNNGAGIEICAPDTYESLPVNACDHELKDCMGLSSCTQDVAAMRQISICGISLAEPQKEEIAFDSSNGSSEKTDFDSVGEDIAKSMISLLLPRAIPLLTYTSRKKRKKINRKFDASSDTGLTIHGDKKMISPSINSVVSPEAGTHSKFTTPTSHVNFDHTEAVASDSLDVDKYGPQDAIDLHLNAKGESKVPVPQNTVCGMLNEEDITALTSIVEELMEQDSNQTGCPVSKENNCRSRSSHVPEDSNKLQAPSMTEEKKRLGNIGIGNHVDHDSEQNHESAGSFWDHTTLNFSQKYVSQEGMHEYSTQIDVSDIVRKMLPENASEAEETAAVSCSNSVSRGNDYHFGETSKFNENMPGTIIDLIGCYNHPWPVLSVLLSPSEDHVNLCVVCGLRIDSHKTLFFYKVSTENSKMGCPSFVGRTSAVFPSFDSLFSTAVERSCLEFTPSGRNLVMLGSIKAPYCRENNITCSCSMCASVPFSENAIRVVQVNFGYVTVLVELKSFDRIVSVLVCEPDYLVALGESGRMHVWLMNQSWSVPKEEFNLPSRDCLTSLVELQKIPQFPYWVIGFSGFSEFTLWDISKRTLISKFSCLDHSIRHFIPVTSIRWHLGPTPVKENVKELVDQLVYGKVPDFGQEESGAPHQGNEESIAVWLLVATEPDGYAAYSCQEDANASWRLALLAKGAVITGSVIDPKAASTGALSGYGIVGTIDGSVYTWEFSTGTELVALHHLQGERVSCIATTGDSNSRIFAASGEGGKLVIYRMQIEGK